MPTRMDPLNVAGEGAELEYEQMQEKREADWLKANKIQWRSHVPALAGLYWQLWPGADRRRLFA